MKKTNVKEIALEEIVDNMIFLSNNNTQGIIREVYNNNSERLKKAHGIVDKDLIMYILKKDL
jgi:hypothetical protein